MLEILGQGWGALMISENNMETINIVAPLTFDNDVRTSGMFLHI